MILYFYHCIKKSLYFFLDGIHLMFNCADRLSLQVVIVAEGCFETLMSILQKTMVSLLHRTCHAEFHTAMQSYTHFLCRILNAITMRNYYIQTACKMNIIDLYR